jgi:hypothetical protein
MDVRVKLYMGAMQCKKYAGMQCHPIVRWLGIIYTIQLVESIPAAVAPSPSFSSDGVTSSSFRFSRVFLPVSTPPHATPNVLSLRCMTRVRARYYVLFFRVHTVVRVARMVESTFCL